ncbi:flavodoxin [Sebaldella sp. S0638]|uniref:flavodoxin n=1 Tax=Sebaldella sp. S0638 TaxID=2957809 RepID=UPI00209F2B34|nr:flavodoxin [Sebaldella sp. S0638]MCP1224217.1 flavodoxin [Sebaldella sp. S0638]
MDKKILIAYYSYSGNTGEIASFIQKHTEGTLFEIIPVIPYPLGYNETVKLTKLEIKAGIKPELKTKINNVESYDTIFIGSPNWWSTIAPPIASFLSEYDLSGKIIIPFCTHGGGGHGSIFRDIALLCPHSDILNGFEVFGKGNSTGSDKILSWLNEIGIN